MKNINNIKVVDATEFLSLLGIIPLFNLINVSHIQIGVKTYNDSEIQQAELVGGFNPNELQKYSAVFIEINRLLSECNTDAKAHFYSSDKIVTRNFVE